MSDSPYAPPAAHVEDPRVGIARPPRPVRVGMALLWSTLALSVPLIAVQHYRATSYHWGSLAFTVVLLGSTAGLFVCIQRGRNWARITYLLYFAMSLYYAAQVSHPFGRMTFQLATNMLSWTLILIAIVLLFIPRSSRDWFSAARRQG
jgi:hypothetical protein